MIKSLPLAFFAALLVGLSFSVSAGETFQLTPADGVDDAALEPGLAVRYAYGEAKTLHQAEGYRSRSKPGSPIKGFLYGDTDIGQKVMTSDASEYVVAFITGFMKLEKGVHELEFQSNDGVRIHLGGVQVYEHDERHPCVSNGAVSVDAPKSGWYPVEVLYFQRLSTACLDLSIRKPGGEWDWTEENIYAHKP